MPQTPNKGKLRVCIDWDDDGVPIFDQTDTDQLNLFRHNAFPHSEQGHTESGAMTITPHIAPDSPLPLIDMYQANNHYKNINPFGVEYLEFDTTGGQVIIGTNHDTTLLTSTDYTLWVWLALENDFTNTGDHTLAIGARELLSDGTTVTHTTNTPIDMVGGWTQTIVAHHFTTASNAHFFEATLFDVNSDDFEAHGVILGTLLFEDANTDIPVWNSGGFNGFHDEITAYVLSANGVIGKTQWETKLFDEGTLTITIDNQSKFFSPENRDSPLFGFMNPYIRVWVLISDSEDAYHLLWSGTTQQFELQTGIFNERQATITCRQGRYSVDAQDIDSFDALDGSSSAGLITSMFNGGYSIATGAVDTSFTSGEILEDTENGITVPIFGTDFVGNGNKSFISALEDISELNGNYLFLSRYGRVIFKTYGTVKDADPEELPYGLTLETHYTFSPYDLYKSIVVNYDVYSFASSGIEMQGQEEVVPAGSTAFPFTIYPEYNNKPLIGDVVLDVTSFLPVDYGAIIASGSANATPIVETNGIYTWFKVTANNSLEDSTPNGLDARISFVSRASTNVWYASETGKIVTVTGIEGRGLPTFTYNNPLITTDDMADDFSDQQAHRRASIVSWFDTARLTNKNDAAIDFAINHTVGSVIFIQEEQSGNIPKHSIIIGESFRFTPTYIEIDYVIAPTGGEVDIAAFTYEAEELAVSFENLSTSVPEATYIWEFGD